MAHHARIEEVSDSDPDDMDPTDFDPSPASITLPSRPAASASSLMDPSAIPSISQSSQAPYDASKTKHYHCLYPLYFDAGRTRTEGRRVSGAAAVANPLARTLADATASLGLSTVFEPGKTHPRDWANPGRVRVLLKRPDESWAGGKGRMGVQNKHHLYGLVARYLAAHPTTAEAPLRVRVPGLPVRDEGKAPEGVGRPRGWKVGEVLPMHSAAVSGGGVSDNLLRDMMAEMKGERKPSEIEAEGGGGGGAGGKKKKDKKGKGKG
ncbi:MAG: signal recognition particle subunit [Bathelium mastoideum]|nr:MAG: signal recognition particle subunit [Bathelium mastoideum]